MTLLSFTQEFAPAVDNRTKLQTIRNIGKTKFKAGDALQLYKGRYAPGERIKMHDAVCLSVHSVQIEGWIHSDGKFFCAIILDGEFLNQSEHEKFAKDDGFENLKAFVKYFKSFGLEKYQLIKWGLPFETLDVGKTYLDGNGGIFTITAQSLGNGHYLAKMVGGDHPDYYETFEKYNEDGSIFELLPCPQEHNLYLQVAP